MKKSRFIALTVILFIVALTATILISCNQDDTLILPQSTNDNFITVIPDNTPSDSDAVDNELPPESFVGTVVEETTTYMIVEPNEDEAERDISNRIRVEYLHDHIDYLYGNGRKVVITYIPPVADSKTITTDDIRHDGFEDFELSVQYRNDSIPARFAQIQYAGLLTMAANSREFDENSIDYNLYYYGLQDVYVTVDGNTLPLKEALTYGKVTLDGIIADCNRRASFGEITEQQYKDGGSSLYDFGDYKIIKYHTLDGNRDVYIGTSDMGIDVKNATAFCIGAYIWNNWGVRLHAEDVTNNGATVKFNQKGGKVTGELQTGEAFWLEKKVGNKWISCDTNPLDYAFHMVAYMLKKDGTIELENEWEWLYGTLEEGQYRIAKEVMDFRKTADYDRQIYYAYFEIPKVEICSYPINEAETDLQVDK